MKNYSCTITGSQPTRTRHSKFFLRAGLLIPALLLLAGGAARAQLLLVDVDFKHAGASIPAQTGAAVIGSAGDSWNAVNVDNSGTSGSASNLLSVAGNTTSIGTSFTYTSGGFNDSNGTTMDAATTPLMEDYFYSYVNQGTGAAPTLTFTGLSAYTGDPYEIVLYASGDSAGQGGTYTLTENAVTGLTLSTTATNRMISGGVGDAYQVFTGTILGGDITLTGAYANSSQFAPINGFQLEVVPEPSTWVMVLSGLGALAFVHLRRRSLMQA